MITRLDEFSEHLDYIKVSTNNISGKVVPQLLLMAVSLELLFKKIDAIDEYVTFVQQKVNQLDKKIYEIESRESTSLLNVFNSFWKPKKTQPTQPIQFNATEYFIDPVILQKNIARVVEEHEKSSKVYHNIIEEPKQIKPSTPPATTISAPPTISTTTSTPQTISEPQNKPNDGEENVGTVQEGEDAEDDSEGDD